jgi:hypothetical protein
MMPKLGPQNHSKFCSELVAAVYARVNHPASIKARAETVTPAHLDKLMENTRAWTPVTQKFKDFFELKRSISGALESEKHQEQMLLRSVDTLFLKSRKSTIMASVSQAKRILETDKLLWERMCRLHELTPQSKAPVLPDRQQLLNQTEKQLFELRATYWDMHDFTSEKLAWLKSERKARGYPPK